MNSGQSASNANVASSLVGMVASAKDKWNASGANEAVGRMTASIPDSTKAYVSNVFKREHIRSIGVLFGIGEERPFYLEKNPALLMERLRHNMTFFYLNYMILVAVLFFLTLLTSPFALIGIGTLVIVWMWMIRASQSGSLIFFGISIPQKTAVIGLSAATLFALMWLLSNVFWWTLFSSGLMVALHALFRDASMHKDMGDVVAMSGDLDIHEDSAFLNPDSRV